MAELRLAFTLALLLAVPGCRKPPPVAAPSDRVLLPIADRPWAKGAPEEGWCGEASVQMVALHFGAWIPQREVNRLGHPVHPDLWEDELPGAMRAAGLKFNPWEGADEKAFIEWIIREVRDGHPVIVGVKLLPSDHPDYDVDHLMPVVGFDPTGLIFDTNMVQRQSHVSYADLAARKGMAFAGPKEKLFGWSVLGFGASPRVSLQVKDETPQTVRVSAFAEPLEANTAYLLKQEDLAGGSKVILFTTAGNGSALLELELPADQVARISVSKASVMH